MDFCVCQVMEEEWDTVRSAIEREYGDSWMRYLVIEPGNVFVKTWDPVLVIVMLYIVLRAPYTAAFFPVEDEWMRHPDRAFDVLLVIDVVLRFFLATTNEDGEAIVLHSAIAKRYLSGTFYLDLIAALASPVMNIWTTEELLANNLYFLRILQVAKVLRSTSVDGELFAWLRVGYTTRHRLRLLQLIVVAFSIAHIGACVWIYIDRVEASENGWTRLYEVDGLDRVTVWLSSVYWAFATLSSVGYGDISAHTDHERWFAILMILVGAVLFAETVGRLTSMAQEMNANKAEMRKRILGVNEFVKAKRLDPALRVRTREYFDFISQIGHDMGMQKDLLNGMSPSLRRAVTIALNEKIVEAVPIFKHGGPGFQAVLVRYLRPVICLREEYVFVSGEVVDAMYFIRSGQVQIVDNRGMPVTSLDPGSFFGETWLLDKQLATQNVRCSMHSELYSLEFDGIRKIVEAFPNFEQTIRKISQLRQLHIRTATKGAFESRGGEKALPPPYPYGSWDEVENQGDFGNFFRDLLENSRIVEASEYAPKPVDLSRVEVPANVTRVIDIIAENSHDVWAVTRISQGWMYGPKRDNAAKLHPDLIPYSELAEETKEYDKNIANTMVKTTIATGWSIIKSEDVDLDSTLGEQVKSDWEFGQRDPDAGPEDTYVPRPFPTDDVDIPEKLTELVDVLAHANHEAWSHQRMEEGWSWGVKRNDSRKLHNCLLPLELLTDAEKEVEVVAVEETVKLLLGMGFMFLSKEEMKQRRQLAIIGHARKRRHQHHHGHHHGHHGHHHRRGSSAQSTIAHHFGGAKRVSTVSDALANDDPKELKAMVNLLTDKVVSMERHLSNLNASMKKFGSVGSASDGSPSPDRQSPDRG